MAKMRKLRKQLEGIRNDLGDLYNTLNSLEETIQKSNSIWQSMGTTGVGIKPTPIVITGNKPEDIQKALHERYPALAPMGAPEEIKARKATQEEWEAKNNADVPGSPENPVVEPRMDRGRKPRDLQHGITNPMGGRPVPRGVVEPDKDPEASDYSFWFTPEELERLGIADMSYHLEEVPGREGRLRIVQGPPTQLLPGHEELVREKMEEKDSE